MPTSTCTTLASPAAPTSQARWPRAAATAGPSGSASAGRQPRSPSRAGQPGPSPTADTPARRLTPGDQARPRVHAQSQAQSYGNYLQNGRNGRGQRWRRTPTAGNACLICSRQESNLLPAGPEPAVLSVAPREPACAGMDSNHRVRGTRFTVGCNRPLCHRRGEDGGTRTQLVRGSQPRASTLRPHPQYAMLGSNQRPPRCGRGALPS
jgi:hypothetical protein